jgi:hypothetical protein
MTSSRQAIDAFAAEFARYRGLAEKSTAQLAWTDLRVALVPETNSIAAIMKHVAGNLHSRWTDPFTTDGEKPWREREAEFVDDFPAGNAGREAAFAAWTEGWRELGLAGAHMVFNPNATKPGLSNRLWEVEGPAAAVATGYFVLQLPPTLRLNDLFRCYVYTPDRSRTSVYSIELFTTKGHTFLYGSRPPFAP